jgi:dolichol-phosphate mannosyltransferase
LVAGRGGRTFVISVVIPVYNERDSLQALHGEIAAVAGRERLELEVVFVDDGSIDGSWAVIAELAGRDPRVRGLRLRRNFGKAAALSAGFHAAAGEVILTLDADLQDDPAEIPRFLAALAHGAARGQPLPPDAAGPDEVSLDVVSGWKRQRHDPWHKVGPSRVFNFLVSRLTGVRLHDHNCGMKCYRAAVVREVRLYGELHRFIPVLAAARGFRFGEIEIQHRPRRFGSSKYGVHRFLKGFLDLLTVKFLTGYGRRPQHLLGTLGLASFLLGNVLLLYLTVTWFINFYRPGSFPPLHERPLLQYAIAALLMGAQMMSIGFLAELMTAYQARDEEAYSIREQTPGVAPGATRPAADGLPEAGGLTIANPPSHEPLPSQE